MYTVQRRATLVASFLLTIFFPLSLLAEPGRPLPVLELLSPDGSSTTTAQLPLQAGQWLLLYIHPDHRSSNELLRQLNDLKYEGIPKHIVIVLAGVTPAQIPAHLAKFPMLARAFWYADPQKKTGAALGLTGIPVVVGVKDGSVAWVLNGLPHEQGLIQSLATSWVKQ